MHKIFTYLIKLIYDYSPTEAINSELSKSMTRSQKILDENINKHKRIYTNKKLLSEKLKLFIEDELSGKTENDTIEVSVTTQHYNVASLVYPLVVIHVALPGSFTKEYPEFAWGKFSIHVYTEGGNRENMMDKISSMICIVKHFYTTQKEK